MLHHSILHQMLRVLSIWTISNNLLLHKNPHSIKSDKQNRYYLQIMKHHNRDVLFILTMVVKYKTLTGVFLKTLVRVSRINKCLVSKMEMFEQVRTDGSLENHCEWLFIELSLTMSIIDYIIIIINFPFLL